MGVRPRFDQVRAVIKRVLKCFKPAEFTVAVTSLGGGAGLESWGHGDVEGYTCESEVKQELPGGGGCVVYRCFVAKGMGCAVTTSAVAKSVMQCWKEVVEEGGGATAAVHSCVTSAYGSGQVEGQLGMWGVSMGQTDCY